MFRTAFPFGYLLITLLLLAIFGAAVLTLGWGLVRRRWLATVVGSAMMLGVGMLVVAQIYFESLMEWNPSIKADSEVLGQWADDKATIDLRADHTCTGTLEAADFAGTWRRDDWNLKVTFEKPHTPDMRFISWAGELRLMVAPPDDPDMWDGYPGLKRQPE